MCGLGSCGWDTRCLLYCICSRDSCVLGNVCGKVSAIAVGILKTEAVVLAPNQIPGVAAGVESVEQVCWSGYNNTQLFVMLLGVLTRLACLQRRSYSVPCKWAQGHCPSPCLLDIVTLSMSKYHRAALNCESPQALSEVFPSNPWERLYRPTRGLLWAFTSSTFKATWSKTSTLSSDISSAGCRVTPFLSFGAVWSVTLVPRHMEYLHWAGSSCFWQLFLFLLLSSC